MVTRTRRVTASSKTTMTIPEEAVKKLTIVVDQLSREVVLGNDNWETVVVSKFWRDKEPGENCGVRMQNSHSKHEWARVPGSVSCRWSL